MLELEDERSVSAQGRSVLSYHTSLVRALTRFEPAARKFLELDTPSLEDIQEIARKTKRLWVLAKDLGYLIELLTDPRIHNHTTHTVSHGPFVSKRTNCGDCKKCKAAELEYPHGPYLYYVKSNKKWESWGLVQDYLLDDFFQDVSGNNRNHTAMSKEIEENLQKLAEFREENHRLEAVSNGGIEQ